MKLPWDKVVEEMHKGKAVELQQNGGHLIPDQIMELIAKSHMKPLSIGFGIAHVSVPLTRRQRLKLLWMSLRWRVVTAAEVLAGKHECYDPWDD